MRRTYRTPHYPRDKARHRYWSFYGIITLLALLGGCASLPSLPATLPPGAPSRVLLSDVPFSPQEKFQCGPAALAMALNWSGVSISADALTPIVYTPQRQGSLQVDLSGAARRNGRLAYPVSTAACLLAEIAAGRPVIVLQNLGVRWWPVWHYAVVIGFNQSTATLIMHSGTTAQREVGWATFQRTWRRAGPWGLLVLPPGVLPACVEEQTYLTAALGLEQAAQWNAAATAFETAAQQWPRSFAALMAVGNIRYRQGDLRGAAQAFQAAVDNDPNAGTAYNNLAQVLMEQGCWDKAERTAERAVELGGRNSELFRETLDQIRAAHR